MSTQHDAPGDPLAGELPRIVAPHGDLDTDTLGPLRHTLTEAADAGQVVVLDARGITFADSSFLNLLLSTHQRTDLRVAAVPPQLARLLRIVGVDQVLKVYTTAEEALTG
ncbi:STAS domain-containing protein [Actinacidiphila alni]|uniref:STAS domain-containing protein n=1 Tax=Actinacidiphila alni TaxID=380248 RepID=UPI003408BC51